jgi:hypothetical protein
MAPLDGFKGCLGAAKASVRIMVAIKPMTKGLTICSVRYISWGVGELGSWGQQA